MKRPAALALVLLATPAAAQAPTLNESEKAVIGSWEFSNADRDKLCTVTFKADRAGAGYKVEFEPKCLDDFPMVKDVTGWRYNENDLLRLLDAKNKSVIEFSEVETGMFEAPTPGFGFLFLQNAAAAGPPPKPADQIAGEYAMMRGAGKPLCTFVLKLEGAGDGFVVEVKPPCDPSIARFNFKEWRMDRGELMLTPARGNPWRFEEADANRWQRVPESPNPYLLVRQ